MKFYGASYILNGKIADSEELAAAGYVQKDLDEAYQGTIAYSILSAHSVKGAEKDKPISVKFDALASHDITYVGIIQTAKASGLQKFPLPYVLTNCHNSLCAVGGTINEDDHLFGLSAAKKYGGIFVPAHQAVIHTYMRECFARCGAMILGSDSHTRYGALGTMAMGEGGPELVKQLLGMTYDVKYPQVVAIVLKGAPRRGVGPHDVAIALIGEVFKKGIVKNKVLEFIGEGVSNLSVEYRNGIDVMTTETACLSSIWQTDYKVKEYLAVRGRADGYKKLEPKPLAYYDEVIEIDLSEIEPMIALPFHPSNAYKLSDLIAAPGDILSEASKNMNELLGGKVKIDLTKKIKKGGVATINASWSADLGGNFKGYIGTKGSCFLRGSDMFEFDEVTWKTSDMAQAETLHFNDSYKYNQDGVIFNIHQYFQDRLKSGKPIRTPLDEGIKVLKLSTLALESSRDHKEIILADRM